MVLKNGWVMDHRPAFFVINLDRSPERLATIRAGFAGHGRSFERVQALDGATLPKEALRAVYKGEFSLDGGCYLHDSWVAITLSHLRALEAFLATDKLYGVIIEDDVVMTAEAFEVIDHLALEHARGLVFDGVELAGAPDERWDLMARAQAFGPFMIGRPAKTTPVSGCMLYTREGAGKLLRYALPVRTHWDNYVSLSWLHGVRHLTVRPFPVGLTAVASTYSGLPPSVPAPTRLDRFYRKLYRLYQGPRRFWFRLRWLGFGAGLKMPQTYRLVARRTLR